jgi:eukaryotic translation initiation factor 2C
MYENNQPVDGMGVGRKVIDKLQEIYASELTNVNFAYVGDKNLFTIGALQHVKNVYTVVVEDASSAK